MLRHDHGSNYMSGDFQDEIECLGIEASPSFVREPQGNGVAERFIRTLKENLLWARNLRYDRRAPSRARRVRPPIVREHTRFVGEFLVSLALAKIEMHSLSH
jgi:transposase InsO family protein